jgi:hypothetical protein
MSGKQGRLLEVVPLQHSPSSLVLPVLCGVSSNQVVLLSLSVPHLESIDGYCLFGVLLTLFLLAHYF